jgi:hypothetical protein
MLVNHARPFYKKLVFFPLFLAKKSACFRPFDFVATKKSKTAIFYPGGIYG